MKNMSLITILILILIGLAAGMLGGMVGVGGGIIIIPALVYFLGISQFEAQGTSIAIMLPPIGILAAMNYYKKGYVNWQYALIIAAFFIVGSYFGSKFVLEIPQNTVKKTFGIFLLLVSLKMIFWK
jgi:uncharacterized membrane protein YfcA